MDQDCIVRTNLVHELADGLQEWLALDITNRTADFDDGNLSISGGGVVAVKRLLISLVMWGITCTVPPP